MPSAGVSPSARRRCGAPMMSADPPAGAAPLSAGWLALPEAPLAPSRWVVPASGRVVTETSGCGAAVALPDAFDHDEIMGCVGNVWLDVERSA